MNKISKALSIARKKRKKFADGGSAFDWSGVGEAMPEHIGRDRIVDPVANAAMETATLPKRLIDASKADVAQYQQHGIGEEGYEPKTVGPATELAMNMVGGAGAVPAEANSLRSGATAFRNYVTNKMKTEPSLMEKTLDRYRRLLDNPAQVFRQDRGYTEPAYRGIKLYNKDTPSPVHDFGESGELYSTASPELADMYSDYLQKHPGYHVPEGAFGPGAQVMPLYINPKDYHYFDAAGKDWRQANPMAMKEARSLKKKGVIVDNVHDEPNTTKSLPPQKIYITFPSGAPTVKSRFAKEFNPESPDMLRAKGGSVGSFDPERASAYGLQRQGMIKSDIPGRTDKINMNVPSGSYIIPADIPSAIGEGNSMAGSSILNKMFNSGPYGMNLPRAKKGTARIGTRKSSLSKMRKFAEGGATEPTPIVAAGGEYVIHPETVMALGGGDMDVGHNILDAFVKQVRSKHISTLKSLKPPKGSK